MRTFRTALKGSAQTIALAAFAVAAQAQPPSQVSRYACAAGAGDLKVERSGTTAHVTLAGHTYDLTRKQSSIGDKFISATAALIIDGDSAVFVSENNLNLGACNKQLPVAAAE